jgi:cell division protein FtsB
MFWLGCQIYDLQKERISLTREYRGVQQEYDELAQDNQKMREKMEYLSEPRNLEKELRAKFNYVHPWEELIIVVPKDGEAE